MSTRKPPSLDDVDPGTAYRGYLAAVRNAHRYLRDADLLASDESYGHAVSLCLLGLEEMGKANLYLFRAIGHLQAGARGAVEVHRSHMIKHMISAGLQGGFDAIDIDLVEFGKRIDACPEGEEEAKAYMENLLHDFSEQLKAAVPELPPESTLLNEAQGREPKKHRGLYVEVGPGDELWTPEFIGPAEFSSEREKLARFLNHYPAFDDPPIGPELEEFIRQLKAWTAVQDDRLIDCSLSQTPAPLTGPSLLQVSDGV